MDTPVPDTRATEGPLKQGYYQCSRCERTFSRADHLQRHVRSHIQERPYQCEKCHKGFGRQDLLKRHAACHETDGQGAKRTRRQVNPGPRVSQACKACAAAKLKCDEDKACSRCLRKGIACLREARSGDVAKSPVADLDKASTLGEVQAGNVPDLDNGSTQIPDSPKSHLLSADEQTFQVLDSDFSSFFRGVMAPLAGSGSHSLNDLHWPNADTLDNFGAPQGLLDYTTKGDFGLEDLAHNFSTLPPSPSQYFSQPFASFEGATSNVSVSDRDGKHITLGIEAYQQSALGRWEPSNNDKADADMESLSVLGPSPHSSLCVAELGGHTESHLDKHFPASARDEVLSMTLDICKPERKHLVTKTFPTAELFLKLVQRYFAFDRHQTCSFIHGASFELDQQRPELLAVIISTGAILSDSKPLGALGFALQEVARLALPSRFEESNKVTRSLWALQTFIGEIDIAIWSSIKRKMEIAESHRNMPITMLRRSGRFGKPSRQPPLPLPSDTGEALHQKWLAWVKQESYNRLVYRSFIMDIQISIAYFTTPLISFSELKTPLPSPRSLWFATDAEEWKAQCLSLPCEQARLGLVEYLRGAIELDDCSYDASFSELIIIHGIWGMIWQYFQLREALNKPKASNAALALQHQEIIHILDQFQIHMDEDKSTRPESRLMLELVQMRLYIPFQEVESFAGRGNMEDARQALPILNEWAETQDARQAIWHAGQVLRAAYNFRLGHLGGFFAIAVLQAALSLWVYSVMSQGNKIREETSAAAPEMPNSVTICLNGPKEPAVKRFIGMGKPSLCVLQPNGPAAPAATLPPIPLTDQEGICWMVADMLGDNYGKSQAIPPLVENLQQLLRHIGRAATTVAYHSSPA